MTILRSVTSGGAAGAPNAVLDYSEEQNVADSALTTLSSLVAAGTQRITTVTCSGSAYAKYFCVLDTNVIAVQRSGPLRNVEFYLNLQLSAGQIFETKVIHYSGAGDEVFDSTILGF